MTELQLLPERPRVLVVGGGAREHAIVWKLAQSPHQPQLFALPGNPGMAALASCIPLAVDDVAAITEFAQSAQIDLVVVGPEAPLALGLVDLLVAAGVRVFGPTAAAARLEASKAYAKAVMLRAGVATAAGRAFTDAAAAAAYVRNHGAPIVIKADGLAAGKGVTVARTVGAALGAIDSLLRDLRFGAAGGTVVIEECLVGREASLMFFVDGQVIAPMASAQDHKPVFDGDAGPNTGGMGAFAPVPAAANGALTQQVAERIVRPVLATLAADGICYRGVLYVGLMLTDAGPKVIEFNCRFGDPETEVVLPLLAADLLDILFAIATGRLASQLAAIRWRPEFAVGVVLAAAGYPSEPRTGDEIDITAAAVDSGNGLLFHAGTARLDGRLLTAGGRVLTAVGTGATLAAARAVAYGVADGVYFDGKHARRDIAKTLP